MLNSIDDLCSKFIYYFNKYSHAATELFIKLLQLFVKEPKRAEEYFSTLRKILIVPKKLDEFRERKQIKKNLLKILKLGAILLKEIHVKISADSSREKKEFVSNTLVRKK
jgi:hypothetical protein